MHGSNLHCNAPQFTVMVPCPGPWLSGIALAVQLADWLPVSGWVSAETHGVELILQHFKSSPPFHICGGQDQGAGVSSILWPSLQNTSLGSFQENLLQSVWEDLYVASVSLQWLSLRGPMVAHSCSKGVYTTSRVHTSAFSKQISQPYTTTVYINVSMLEGKPLPSPLP